MNDYNGAVAEPPEASSRSGYPSYKACLPVLLGELSSEETTADWVGSAGAESDPQIQKEIVAKAFGQDAVRSVPTMGKRDFDHDAERIGGAIVRTSQMSSGFREMAKEHLPTAREMVVQAEAKAQEKVTSSGFSLKDIVQIDDPRRHWIEKQGGQEHVDRCLSFAVWFCQKLVDSTEDDLSTVQGNLALGSTPELFGTEFGTFMAHWSDNNLLTLAIDVDCFWQEPLGPEALGILVHEAAHARNMHHGKGFVDEVERLAGVAAAVMFEEHAKIVDRWPGLVSDIANNVQTSSDISTSKTRSSWFGNLIGGASRNAR